MTSVTKKDNVRKTDNLEYDLVKKIITEGLPTETMLEWRSKDDQKFSK